MTSPPGLRDVAEMSLEEKLNLFGGPLQAPAPGLDPETLSRGVLEAPTELELQGA
jgi:hypothetical protein